MIVLTGDSSASKVLSVLSNRGWGRMLVTKRVKLMPDEPWGFDNGAYMDYVRGEIFNPERFYKWLKKAYTFGTPYIAVCPDIVAGGKDSLDFSLDYMRHVLPQDWPWYLAVQDGMTPEMVEPHLDKFSGIFLGGSDEFKPSAHVWCDLAHKHSKRFHWGRIQYTWLRYCISIGADSADGTGMLWEYSRLYKFCRAYDYAFNQMRLMT
jgi:hypothetical protein